MKKRMLFWFWWNAMQLAHRVLLPAKRNTWRMSLFMLVYKKSWHHCYLGCLSVQRFTAL